MMGLHRVQLKKGAAERFPAVMASLGIQVIRTEQRANGKHYFYQDPKSGRELGFWTNPEDAETYWYCGASPSAKTLADAFWAAGMFET